ncbi:phenazine biosynthesis protein PhzF family [Burkholderia sp. OK233]|nr:phenazine biosynthesis protein PhzF family [Burkholderia sp. OK233]
MPSAALRFDKSNMKRSYKVVDVFTNQPLRGNPVAVLLDAEGLDTEEMQAIARWTNLSETTFVLPPTTSEADYRLRIFTPRSELPFAGHPTIGSAYALLEAGRVATRPNERLVQECSVGLVDLTVGERNGERQISFRLPGAQVEEMDAADVARLATIVGRGVNEKTSPAILNVGPRWIIAQLHDAQSVLNLQPDFAELARLELRLDVTGLTVFGAYQNGDADIEVRTFAPSCGVEEDPVCGSGNASVAAFQWERGMLPAVGKTYVASQGGRVGRAGKVHVSVNGHGNVNIGGACVTCIEGHFEF